MKKRLIALTMALVFVILLLPQGGLTVLAAEDPTVTVDSLTASPGSTVEVNVTIADNPGVMGATLTLTYDPALTLKESKNGEAFQALTMTRPGALVSPCNFVWDGQELSASEIRDGVILTLTFEIAEDAEAGAELPVSLSYAPGSVFNSDLQPIRPVIVNGGVSVLDYVPGDLNGDENVNTLDVILLRRYLAGGYNVTINEPAADVNADEQKNTLDVILMRRFIAGGYKDADGNPLVLVPSPRKCSHTLEAIPYKAPTATEDGNIAYWHCTKCDKYFSDAQGTRAISPADTVLPATGGGLGEKEHAVTYDVANGDEYLERVLATSGIVNPNPDRFSEDQGLVLSNSLSVAGYRFLGWFDLPSGSSAANVKRIEPGTTHDVELYAHWEKRPYTIQFNSELIPQGNMTYYVDQTTLLPAPRLDGYRFVGWSDSEGNIVTSIPAGTVGSKTYTANWLSERNQAWAKSNIGAPIIYEDQDVILFAYEIGEIRNVPLYVLHDFGYINAGGVSKTETKKVKITTEKSQMDNYVETVSKATTASSSWTLSSDWSQTTEVNQKWAEENGITQEEIDTVYKSETGNWNVSSGASGTKTTKTLDTRDGSYLSSYTNKDSYSDTGSAEVDMKVYGQTGTKSNYVGAELNAKMGYESTLANEKQRTTQGSSTKHTGTETTDASGWNTSSSYGGSNTYGTNHASSTALSNLIKNERNYGESYVNSQGSEESQGLDTTTSNASQYTSAVTYSTVSEEEVTRTFTTDGTVSGYHRWIVAGTAHVFGVVGYDMASRSYFTYTYSVMDDETHEFEDYSYDTAGYNDCQSSYIPFEVPFDIADYVFQRTAKSDGLVVNNSGTVIEYNGDDPYVMIPEYWVKDNQDGTRSVIKITAIAPGVFKDNANITVVELSDFITEIPDHAFENCVNLDYFYGKNVTSIGAYAFAGCDALCDVSLNEQITYLGEHAFDTAGRLSVRTDSLQVAGSVLDSAALNLVLTMLPDSDFLDGQTLTVGSGTHSFELAAMGNELHNVKIVSDAGKTVINRARLNTRTGIPLVLSSPVVELKQSAVTARGIAAALTAPSASVALLGDVTLTSDGTTTLLVRDMSLSDVANATVAGVLIVGGNIRTCQPLTNTGRFLSCDGDIIQISQEQFQRLLTSYTLYFDPGEGTCDTASRIVPNGTALGALPMAQRDHYAFGGWEDEQGNLVTESTVFSDGEDHHLTARWALSSVTLHLDPNGGTCDDDAVDVPYNLEIGPLPEASRSYYTFEGWYTEAQGGTRLTENTVCDWTGESTVYAHWTNAWTAWGDQAPPEGYDGEAVEQRTMYRTSSRQTTSSTSSSLSGWTKSGSHVVYGNWGAWGPWDTPYQAASDTKQVETATVYPYYCYLCTNCGAHSPYWNTSCSNCGAWIGENFCVVRDPQGWSWNSYGGGKYYQYINGELWFQWDDGGGAQTGYRSRTRTATTYYDYWRWGGWSSWTTVPAAANSNLQVETKTQYRWKDAV